MTSGDGDVNDGERDPDALPSIGRQALFVLVTLSSGVLLFVVVVLGAIWLGNVVDAFLTAQLGRFESQATGYVVLGLLLTYGYDRFVAQPRREMTN